MKSSLPFFLTLILFGSGCVSQKKYQELEDSKKYYEQQAARADSLENMNRLLTEEVREVEGYYRTSLNTIESMKAANQSLNNSYQELLQRFNRMLDQGQDVLSTSSYEKQSLTEQLSAYRAELDRRERYLTEMERQLAAKEDQLRRAGTPIPDLRQDLAQRDQIIQQLQYELQRKDATIQQIKQNITAAMSGFSASDFTVTEKRGKLYLSMSQNLLFRSGSTRIDDEGKRAISQLASALKNNQDIDIIVEGHTDSDGSPAKNWDLSVMRATAVVQELTSNGVSPDRLTAAGRGLYAPVATNNTSEGKALNRRTEIIVTPKLDELMNIINQ